MKTLKARHAELVELRNENSHKEKRYFGANADKISEHTPVYDIKGLDKLVNDVAKEMRLLDMAIKSANATTKIDYDWADDKLGTIA
jgi:mRNA-degrading endonuclease HigB of HigAB toxin-antitoxin module